MAIPTGLQAGESVTVQDVTLLRKQTRAPKHHSDATLLSAMESAGAQLTGEASEAMRERGLGTPATRASIIEGLVARGYVVRDGKALRATSFGEQLIASIHESLKSAALTGDWEARLRRVERKSEWPAVFRTEVRYFVAEVVKEALRGCGGVDTVPASGMAPHTRFFSGHHCRGDGDPDSVSGPVLVCRRRETTSTSTRLHAISDTLAPNAPLEALRHMTRRGDGTRP